MLYNGSAAAYSRFRPRPCRITAPRSTSRPSMVDATLMSTRARAAISLAEEGCHRSITATYTRRSVLGRTSR